MTAFGVRCAGHAVRGGQSIQPEGRSSTRAPSTDVSSAECAAPANTHCILFRVGVPVTRRHFRGSGDHTCCTANLSVSSAVR